MQLLNLNIQGFKRQRWISTALVFFYIAEMLTNELPEKKDRHRQILKISVERPNFAELVRQCLSEEGDYRPSAQDIMTQLSDM